MKKSIIALMGLFTLVACSEDSYQEADKMNEESGSQYQTNSFNPSNPGSPPNQAGGDYVSPWDIWYRGNPEVIPTYTFTNMEGEGYSPFVIEITPFLGLAYYDDINDGMYRDPSQGYALVQNLTNGNYPNLYANSNEIGNLIKAKPIILNGTSVIENEFSAGSHQDHLPVFQSNLSTGWNPLKRYLNIDGSSTPQEKLLLSKFGKLFFVEITIYERANPSNVIIKNRRFQINCSTFSTGDWQPTGVSVAPFGMTHNLVYYKDLLNGPGTVYYHNIAPGAGVCDSREVMFMNQYPSSYSFPFGGLNYEFNIHMVQGALLWKTSGVHLGIRQI